MAGRSRLLVCLILVLGLVTIVAGCGSSGGSDCQSNGKIELWKDSQGTILTSMTFTATKGVPPPPPAPQSVYVKYNSTNVLAVAAAVPPNSLNPLDYGLNIELTSFNTDNPLIFSVSVSDTTTPNSGIYNFVFRFYLTDGSTVLGCQELPVRYNLQQQTSPI